MGALWLKIPWCRHGRRIHTSAVTEVAWTGEREFESGKQHNMRVRTLSWSARAMTVAISLHYASFSRAFCLRTSPCGRTPTPCSSSSTPISSPLRRLPAPGRRRSACSPLPCSNFKFSLQALSFDVLLAPFGAVPRMHGVFSQLRVSNLLCRGALRQFDAVWTMTWLHGAVVSFDEAACVIS